MPSTTESSLPVLIAGAGPCGLVAALVLQQHNVPFVLFEKANRDKLYANVGSGYDLSPTTVKIVKERLGLDTKEAFIEYAGIHLVTLEGQVVRDGKIGNRGNVYQQATRADLQRLLLDKMGRDKEQVLRYGVAVESYEEDMSKGQVTVTLADGSTVVGKALLACDGIHSKIRKSMHGGDDVDPLSYSGTTCYWGVCPEASPGSKLEKAIHASQPFREEGPSCVFGLGTHRAPGSFFVTPNQGKLVWVVAFKSIDPPGTTSDDLRRRGGAVLTEESKQTLLDFVNERPGDFTLMKEILKATPASLITEAGLYDRANRTLPFSSPGKLVALLGDAAHPQSPFLGQGCNMAITDGYVCSMLLSKLSVPEAIASYDCGQRREEAHHVVTEARQQTEFCVSSNWFACWFFRMIMKYSPLDGMVDELAKHDKSNMASLRRLDGEEEPPKHGATVPWGIVLATISVIPIAIYAVEKLGKSQE